jgi:hypothetical protein
MIDTSYALPDVSAALRVGAGVRVGLRVRKTNGASVDIAVAETLYETFALGRGGNAKKDEAYVFRPTERTRAPDLLLSRRDSPLARAPSVDTPGEAEIVMVIRSGSVLPRDADHRVLMPQKTSFDRAEQYGQLDADDDYAEQGAFTAVNLEKDGQYPVLRRNGSTTTDGKLFSANAEPATNRKNPFFPDPAGRRLGVAITRDGRSLSTFEGRAPDLAFWDEDPAAAAPIYLKLQKRKGIGGTFFRGFDGAEELRGQQLHVELGPAEEVDLHLWTFDDFKNTRQRHRLAALAFDRIIWATGKTEAELEELWDQFASLAPVPALQDRLTLKLVHALDRPTRKPAFTRALRAFPISGQPNGPGSWKEVRALIFAPEGSRDPEHLAIQAQPRSSVVQFAGAVDLDRASTGAARIELSWLEFSRVGAARPLGSAPAPDGAWPTAGDAPTRYVFAPARGAHVFELPTIARGGGVSGVDPDADIILEDDYLDTYRLIHTFPDRQARRLVVRSVATSRFLTYLPPVTAAAFGPLGPYEQESLSSNGVKQRLANPGLSDAHVIWIPASSPPPPLTITSPPQPAQFQGQRAVAGGVEITWSQPTRIWLDDWPVAEGMLVGVICKPANLFDVRKPRYDAANPHRYLLADTTSSPAEAANNSRLRSKAGMEDFDALPKWLNDVVTQWGGNPNTNAGASVFITQNRFSGYVASAGNLMLPKGKASGDDPGAPDADCAAEAVAVVGYEAQFDAAVGRWFCDIALDTDGWHEPGVRFGLARYQPHALPGCELSPATAVSPIAVSAPRVVTITRSVDRVIVTIRGSGFTDRATSVDGQLDAHGLAELYGALAPMMCIRFQRVVDGSPFGKIEEREVGSPSGSSWSVEFEIPESERGKRLAILVHEYVLDGVALAGQRGEVGLENSLVKRLLGFEVNAII